MIKMMFGLKKLPNITHDEFHRYWRENHGVLAKEKLPALNAKRYIQSHTINIPITDDPRGLQGMDEPFDGVAEICWDSMESMLEAALTPEGEKAHLDLIEDEKNFIDFSRSAMWFVEEEVFIKGE